MTDLEDLIVNDHEIFDFVHTATLRNDLDGSSDSVAGVTSSRMSFRAMQQIGFVGVQDEARTFSLPAVNCSSTPKVGWRLIDGDSKDWRILSVEKAVMDTCFQCNCVAINDDDSTPLQVPGVTLSAPVVNPSTSIVVTWTHRKPGATETWEVQRSTSSAFTSPTTTTGTSALLNPTTTLTGLTASTIYYIRVRHTNAEGAGPWSETESRATEAA